MHFSTLPILTMLLTTASAVDIVFWHNTWSCGGWGSWSDYISNAQAYTCYSTNSDCHGVEFKYMPGGAKGQTYTDGGCGAYSQEGGSGSYCLADRFVRSANWFWPYKLLRREGVEGDLITGVEYMKPDGTTRKVLSPISGWPAIHELIEAGEWEKLEALPEDTTTAA